MLTTHKWRGLLRGYLLRNRNEELLAVDCTSREATKIKLVDGVHPRLGAEGLMP